MHKYIVEPVTTGIYDGASNGMVPAERLRRSVVTQAAWKSSHGHRSITFLIPGSCLLTLMGFVNLVEFHGSRNRTGSSASADFGHHRLEASCADDSQDLLVYSWYNFFSTVFPSPGWSMLSSTCRLFTFGRFLQSPSSHEYYWCMEADLVAFVRIAPVSLITRSASSRTSQRPNCELLSDAWSLSCPGSLTSELRNGRLGRFHVQ